MADALTDLRREFDAALDGARTPSDVKAIRDRFLSRKSGQVTALLKTLGTLPPDERRESGRRANELKQAIEEALAAREAAVAHDAPPAGAVDVTLPGRRPRAGRRHPLTIVQERVEDIFLGMGYQILEGPELEDDWHASQLTLEALRYARRDLARAQERLAELEIRSGVEGTFVLPRADGRP